jgi:large subunit ribosomal protein L10
MASEKILESKKQVVNQITDRLNNAKAGVFVDYSGINVADDTQLRRELRAAGVEYTVVKNTLTKFALKNVGFEALDVHMEGTTALATSTDDVIAPAKILCKYAKAHENFKIKAGFCDGEVMDENGVKALAAVPSKEQSLVNLMYVLQNSTRNLAVVLNQYVEKMSEPASESAEA